MKRATLAALATLALVSTVQPRIAAADDQQDAAAAQALFDQAVDDMAKKDFRTACPKLEEATRLAPDALGAKALLAECNEGRGRTASAWSQWSMLEALAGRQGQTERQSQAAERAAALKPRLAYATLEIDSETRTLGGLVVKRDGVEVGKAQWDNSLPIDAGTHELTVTAPGYKQWTKRFEVLADGAQVKVSVGKLIRDPNAGKPPPRLEEPNTWQLPLGVTAMVAGGAGLALGGVFGALAMAKNDESNAGPCDETNHCTDEGIALRGDAFLFGTGSTIAFVVGGVIAGGGLVLTLTAPGVLDGGEGDGGEPGAVGVTAVRVGPGGVYLEGRFQ